MHEHQEAYYRGIGESTRQADAARFVTFMLGMILAAVVEATPPGCPQVTPQVERLLLALHGAMSREALQAELDLQDRKWFGERYLGPSLAGGWIEMSIADKPSSRSQQYRLTEQGKSGCEIAQRHDQPRFLQSFVRHVGCGRILTLRAE